MTTAMAFAGIVAIVLAVALLLADDPAAQFFLAFGFITTTVSFIACYLVTSTLWRKEQE